MQLCGLITMCATLRCVQQYVWVFASFSFFTDSTAPPRLPKPPPPLMFDFVVVLLCQLSPIEEAALHVTWHKHVRGACVRRGLSTSLNWSKTTCYIILLPNLLYSFFLLLFFFFFFPSSSFFNISFLTRGRAVVGMCGVRTVEGRKGTFFPLNPVFFFCVLKCKEAVVSNVWPFFRM